MEEKYKEPLEYEKVSKLLTKYAIPSIIAMLVSALYNIVDQIFIGQGVGVLGNAATNVTFPLTTICTAIALLLGIGGASKCSLELGAKNSEKATKAAGNSICLMAVFGIS
ncbi:MAG: MATE family efflux transporter, partial [Clostridioides difficile]|nr:MATE family efflux transporter [Clostridioides difficile]